MSIKVGITGGIGSGKSTVCRVFELLGAPVFKADEVAKNLINTHSEIKRELVRLFGSAIYFPDGNIDRKKLAGIIFNDSNQLKKVNELVHPEVRMEFSNWLKKQDSIYIIHEAAILFESGFYKMMDFSILVTAPENERINRVVKRDGITSEQVIERITRQWTDEQKRKLATIEYKNDNKELLIPQILKTDKQLKEYGKIW